jgi:hypothetical protein
VDAQVDEEIAAGSARYRVASAVFLLIEAFENRTAVVGVLMLIVTDHSIDVYDRLNATRNVKAVREQIVKR